MKATSIHKLRKLLQLKENLEKHLHDDYAATTAIQEDQAVFKIKDNPKYFYFFVKSRQNTKVRVGPFLNPGNGLPNPDPQFSTEMLREQYDSVFSKPSPEWTVRGPFQS